MVSSRSNNQGGDPQMGGQSQLQRFSPRSKGSEPSSCSLVQVTVLGRQVPRTSGFGASRNYFQESQKAVGNKLLLTDVYKISYTLESQHKGSHLKRAWVSPTC